MRVDTDFFDLMGITEIAAELSVSEHTARRATKHPQFPEPVAVLAMGRIWSGADVRMFRETVGLRGRGRPRKVDID